MPYGRGGAGNIEAAQRERAQAAEDVEAQQQQIDQAVPAPASENRAEPQTWAHSGRGGAGNIYSPKELATTGSFAGTEVTGTEQNASSALSGPDGRRSSIVSMQQSAFPTVHKVGRGGAGNYEYSSSKPQGSEDSEQGKEKQREIESAVAQDVEQLAVPAKARIANAGVYRG